MNVTDFEIRLSELESRVKRLEEIHANTEFRSMTRKTSMGEFIDNFASRSYSDLTIGIAYYKEFLEKKTPLTSEIIAEGYREVRETKPKNFSDTIYQNFKKHLLMDAEPLADGTRTFIMTKKGIEYVEKVLSEAKEEPTKL